jgi:hypothetical protein
MVEIHHCKSLVIKSVKRQIYGIEQYTPGWLCLDAIGNEPDVWTIGVVVVVRRRCTFSSSAVK